jgi:hypothetical protein
MAVAACSGLVNVSGPVTEAGVAVLEGLPLAPGAGAALAIVIKAAAMRPSTPYRIGVADAEFMLVLPSTVTVAADQRLLPPPPPPRDPALDAPRLLEELARDPL